MPTVLEVLQRHCHCLCERSHGMVVYAGLQCAESCHDGSCNGWRALQCVQKTRLEIHSGGMDGNQGYLYICVFLPLPPSTKPDPAALIAKASIRQPDPSDLPDPEGARRRPVERSSTAAAAAHRHWTAGGRTMRGMRGARGPSIPSIHSTPVLALIDNTPAPHGALPEHRPASSPRLIEPTP